MTTTAESTVFGRCAAPVRCGHGLVVGAGAVFPEVNYALAPVRIGPETFGEVRRQYAMMVEGILGRMEDLRVPGVMLEFEMPFELTDRPEWGATVTAETRDALRLFHDRSGIPCALRVTVADIRDRVRPPRMRTGPEADRMLASFAACAAAGADLLSIESTGGKEVSDEALTEGDLPGILLGMSVLGAADVGWLWDRICATAAAAGVVPAGDSACGFANTAMRLADMGWLPRTLAAVVRAASAARSLVAFERGARGPGKDCAYEGVYLKSVTGAPMALEGKSATCAHFSHIGNIAMGYADLWSNESVQNVKLLSGFAPAVSAESLAYDCRLMNEALKDGRELQLRDWLVRSDAAFDPQAWVFTPAVVAAVARALREETTPYRRAVGAARAAAEALAAANAAGELRLPAKEREWLDRIRTGLDQVPAEAEALVAAKLPEYAGVCRPDSYGY